MLAGGGFLRSADKAVHGLGLWISEALPALPGSEVCCVRHPGAGAGAGARAELVFIVCVCEGGAQDKAPPQMPEGSTWR